jgi:twitching motility protein PilT
MMLTALSDVNARTVELLLHEGSFPAEIAGPLLRRAADREVWVGELAMQDGLVTGDELALMLAQTTTLSRINLAHAVPDPHALACIAQQDCARHLVLPISFRGGVLHVAMANPFDRALLADLAGSQTAVTVSIATVCDLRDAIARWYAALPPVEDIHALPSHPAAIPVPVAETYICTLNDLLYTATEQQASDLHLTVGAPPLMRIDGELHPVALPKITQPQLSRMIYTILTDAQCAQYEAQHELDIAYSLPNFTRFRLNLFKQRNSMGAIFRAITATLPTLDGLGMPAILHELAARRRGLILITGPSGVGKSTTMAAIIDEINRTRYAHIMTIEDPVEFLFHHGKSEINQRQVGVDTDSFHEALRHAMRQDPDVIFIGEIRDLETMATVLTAAETGHLVLSTLHTSSAVSTVDRIIDMFPAHQQSQVRLQLAAVLESVITQQLLPSLDGRGRVLAQEILVVSDAVRNMIREGKTHMIPSVMQAGARQGMQTMDQALAHLVHAHKITEKEAETYASSPADFRALLSLTG